MKHLFLINPAAGKRDQTYDYAGQIHALCRERGLDYEIRVSHVAGELKKYAREAAETGEELRIYACGGDGTLNEAVNGAAGFPNVALTHFPGGSGNDFIKIFDDPSRFKNLEELIDGEETRFDLIQCGDAYALNICSIGIDARIASEMVKYKHLPGVSGSSAYVLAAAANVVKGVHEPYVVEVNGETYEGDRTMICICSGRWYGGGFNPVPDAEPDDGLLDVLLVEPVTRMKVAQVIGPYKTGKYSDYPELMRHLLTTEVTVRSEKEIVINLDGEALYAKEATFRVIPGGMRFFFPKGENFHVVK